MMDTLTWVLAGFAVYWIGALVLKRQGLLPDYVGLQGPIVTLHTKRGRRFLDWLATPKRFWRAWGNFGVGIALVIMAGTFFVLVRSAIFTLQQPPQETAVNQPRNVLVIPGVNDFLPLSVAPEIILGLLVGLVVHEGGHGLFCRVEDIDIESMGLALLAFIPIGAFVEPDEESRDDADRGGQTRMFAAGVANNFAVTLLAFALLFGPVMATIQVAPGAAVGGALPGSPAANAGLEMGDRVVEVNGQPVENSEQFESLLAAQEDREITVTLSDGETKTITRSLIVTSLMGDSPGDDQLDTGDRIVSVNGVDVNTQSELRAALEDQTTATFTTEGGTEVTMPAGVYLADVQEGEPVANAGLPSDATVVITHINGERVLTHEDLQSVMSDTEAGNTIPIRATVNGEVQEYQVTLGAHPNEDYGYLGVVPTPGVTGVGLDDVGTQTYPAALYASLLDGDKDCPDCPAFFENMQSSFFGRIAMALVLPLAGIFGLPFNFAGFTGGITNFYVVSGPLEFMGGWVFLLANALFWTAWININLGLFNCIPAFPLDGGHILRTSAEAIVSRLPVDGTRQLTTAITTSVGLTMLVSLILMIFGPQLLGG